MSDLNKSQHNKMFNLNNEWKMDGWKMERGINGDGRWKGEKEGMENRRRKEKGIKG